MNEQVVETSLVIHASAPRVWQTLTDPLVTRQLGGEIISDWNFGSEIDFKDEQGNTQATGQVLGVEKEKLLTYHIEPVKTSDHKIPHVQSDIRIELRRLPSLEGEAGLKEIDHDEHTMLHVRVDLMTEIDEDAKNELIDSWSSHLHGMKKIAEQSAENPSESAPGREDEAHT